MLNGSSVAPKSLAPFTFGAGFILGSALVWVSGVHPGWLPVANVAVILTDLSYYAFMGWLFAPDFALQFDNRIKHLRGQVGFSWQPNNPRKHRVHGRV